MIRVFLADDHAVLRQGVRRIVDEQPDLTVVGEAENGASLLRQLPQCDCDVLVLDLSLPDRSGLSLVTEIMSSTSAVNIVVLSMYPEDQLALYVMQAGALAYLNKQRDPEELLTAIRRAAEGRRYVTDTLSDLALQDGVAAREPHRELTAREYQIFIQLIDGISVSEVASALDLASSTVSNHIAAIKRKLGANSIAGIVRYASRVGLV